MQFRNTIIVLVLLILVGGYIYFFQAGKPAEETRKLFNIKADNITKIVLKYPGQEIEVVRSGGAWKLDKPIKTDADSTAITTLTHEIADADVKRTVDEHPTDLAPFGLDKPDVTVVVGTRDKTLPGVEVGKKSPIGYSVYIKTTDNPAVMLTSGGFGPGTKRTLSDLRDHTLMTFKPDDVSKLVIKQDDGTPVELQKEQGKWKIMQPARYDADTERVRTLLASLSNARIDDFSSDNPANLGQYGLDKPALEVSVFTGPGQARQSLQFGKKETGAGKDDYYVRRGEKPNVYTVHTYVFSDADKALNDLRDRTVLAFSIDDVQQVKVNHEGKSFMITKAADGKWTETDGGKSDADAVKVRQFIDRLQDLKADTIAQNSTTNLEKFGLNAAAEEVALMGKNGKSLGSIKLARMVRHNENDKNAPARTDYYALSSASPTVYKLFEYDYTDLMKTPDQLAATKPTAIPSAKASAAAK
jgi:hypothetical protein